MEIIYRHFESLTSTNDWAKNSLRDLPENALLVVSAQGQTAARGQYGRRWIAPSGENLYASFAFLASWSFEPLSFTHVMAYSAARLLKEIGVVCSFKWPNDLLVKEKKIAGILCETQPEKEVQGIVIGIGVNVNMPLETLQTIDQPATSLLSETGKQHSVESLLSHLSEKFHDDLVRFIKVGFDPLEDLLSS